MRSFPKAKETIRLGPRQKGLLITIARAREGYSALYGENLDRALRLMELGLIEAKEPRGPVVVPTEAGLAYYAKHLAHRFTK